MKYSGNLSFWLGILIYLTNSGISLMANEFLISWNTVINSDHEIIIDRPEMFKFGSKAAFAHLDCDTIILRNDRKIIAQSIIRKGEYIYYQLCNPDSIRNRVMHINAIRQIILHPKSSIEKADTLLNILARPIILHPKSSIKKGDTLLNKLARQEDSIFTPLKSWEVKNQDGITKYKFTQGQVVTILLKSKPRHKKFYKFSFKGLNSDSLYLENRATKKISALYIQDILKIETGDNIEALWLSISLYLLAFGLIGTFLLLSVFAPGFENLFYIGLTFGFIGIVINIFYSVENKKRIISNPFTAKWKWTEVKSEINPDKNLKMP
ncbi:MAG: hypothetical protein IPP06_14945 [Saprospiraceae bacterium]|nr:hypothetical protein [Candidatus Vicinibacter affinis]